VELLLVVALLGLLSSVAVPRLNRSVRERELSLASSDLGETLAIARTEAVRRGVKVRFTFDPRTREYGLSVQQFEGDRPGDFGAFGNDLLDARRTLPQGWTLEGLSVPGGAGNELVFEPSGFAEACELRLVDPNGRVAGIGIAQWYEDVNRTGPR
jgi:type IV fimbrial biogenesis protein FimT